VIECGLLSGLDVRRFQMPLAGMVNSGLGPNLNLELAARRPWVVFPVRICSIVAPIQVFALSLPSTPTPVAYDMEIMPWLPAPDP
jgi:hypothetical protein